MRELYRTGGAATVVALGLVLAPYARQCGRSGSTIAPSTEPLSAGGVETGSAKRFLQTNAEGKQLPARIGLLSVEEIEASTV